VAATNVKRENLGGPGQGTIVRIADGAVGDSIVIDLVRPHAAIIQPQLIISDGNSIKIAERFEFDGTLYLPIAIDPTIAAAVGFPPDALSYGSTRELYNGVQDFVSSVIHSDEDDATAITFGIFSSWFSDRLSVAPLLWIIAPPTAARDPLLQLMRLLCRRSFCLADLTLTGLRSIPAGLRPTILTEVSSVGRPLIRTLQASSRRDTFSAFGGKAFDVSCAKVVFANEPLLNPAIAGFPLEVVLGSKKERVRPMDSAEASRVAATLQAKLEMYRLENYNRIVVPDLHVSEFSAPMQTLAQNLAACIVGDNHLWSRIIGALKGRDRQIHADSADQLESIALESLLPFSHEGGQPALLVADITGDVNTIRVGRGGGEQISPEIVGWKLRALGLRTENATGGRKQLIMNDHTRRLIHKLATAYGVPTLLDRPMSVGCKYCRELLRPAREPEILRTGSED
jgi:hypothetical protein